MGQFFQFEADFVESLRCVPMQVRFKLDTCGVKLKLQQWNKFEERDRQQLVDLPCETDAEVKDYRAFLHQLIEARTGERATDLAIDLNPEWNDGDQVPESVQAKAGEQAVEIPVTRWQRLTPLQRFALIKLSRSGHENSNFLPAMQEFKIVAD
jgi:hypothetical protein